MVIKPCVSFIAPFRIYLPEDFIEVTISGKVSLVKPIALTPINVNGTQAHGKNIEISHDIFGYAGRTQFVVIVDEEIDVKLDGWKNEFANSEFKYIESALCSVNRMLEVYRDQDKNNINEKSFHIIQLVRTDIYDVRVFAQDEKLNEVDGLVIRRPFFYRVGFGPAVQRKPQIISEIKKLLKDGTSLPIYRELMNSALNYIWRGQYRLVPVEANTAFESFIPEIINFLDPSVNRSELKDIYPKLLKLETVFADILSKSNKNTISWFTKSSGGWKTLAQSEFKRWHDDCYCLRNRVIHEGYNNVSLQEAQKAYEASLTAINYVQLEIGKIISI